MCYNFLSMRGILLLRPRIGFGLGGAEYHAAEVARRLLERGLRVGIVAHQISFPPEIQREIEYYPVRFKGFGSVPKHLFFIYQAKRILSKLSPYKIVSFFRYPYPTDLFILCDPMIAHLIHQKKTLLASLRPRYRILLELEKRALQQSQRVISLFSLGKRLIQSYYPFASEKTFICHRGMDFSKFNIELKGQRDFLRKKWNFNTKDYLILFVGYDTKRKGLDLLLKVLPDLPERVKLIVAGHEGPSTDRIYYLGRVKNPEELYALSDLFVLPTLYDPGALATLEALASGTPVITTFQDGTSEFVKEGINGFVVETRPLALKSAILKAMDTTFDPVKIHASVKDLTWDNYVDCLLSHLET